MNYAFTYTIAPFWKHPVYKKSFVQLGRKLQELTMSEHISQAIKATKCDLREHVFEVSPEVLALPENKQYVHSHCIIRSESLAYVLDFCQFIFNLGKLRNQKWENVSHRDYVFKIDAVYDLAGWSRYLSKQQKDKIIPKFKPVF